MPKIWHVLMLVVSGYLVGRADCFPSGNWRGDALMAVAFLVGTIPTVRLGRIAREFDLRRPR